MNKQDITHDIEFIADQQIQLILDKCPEGNNTAIIEYYNSELPNIHKETTAHGLQLINQWQHDGTGFDMSNVQEALLQVIFNAQGKLHAGIRQKLIET